MFLVSGSHWLRLGFCMASIAYSGSLLVALLAAVMQASQATTVAPYRLKE